MSNTVCKNLLSLKKIRQINYSAILLINPLLSRNFCQKKKRATQCENYENLRSHFFDRKFVKVTFLLKKNTKELIWRNFLWVTENFSFFHTVSIFFRKNFVKATFLLKKLLENWFHEISSRWERISHFSTVWCSHHFSQKFRKSTTYLKLGKLHCTLISRNIFQLRKNITSFQTVQFKGFFTCQWMRSKLEEKSVKTTP